MYFQVVGSINQTLRRGPFISTPDDPHAAIHVTMTFYPIPLAS